MRSCDVLPPERPLKLRISLSRGSKQVGLGRHPPQMGPNLDALVCSAWELAERRAYPYLAGLEHRPMIDGKKGYCGQCKPLLK